MKPKENKFLKEDKELIISSALIILCLLLAIAFPADKGSSLQIFTKGIFFLVVIPSLYIKIILKKNLSDFGLNLGCKKEGLVWALGVITILLILSYFISKIPGAGQNYKIPAYVAGNFWLFLSYELILINIFLFSYEFFWRGFVLFTFSPRLGPWAIAIQATLFIVFSLVNNDFSWKYYSLPLLSIASGVISYKSKSLIYSYVMSLVFIIILDSYIIYSLNK